MESAAIFAGTIGFRGSPSAYTRVAERALWCSTGRGVAEPACLTLGLYGPLTVEEARRLAKKELARIIDGYDPAEERSTARKAGTVRDLADTYIERHAKRHKRTWRKDERQLERYILPAFGSRKLSEVRRAEVARLHNNIGRKKPYQANRVLANVSTMFSKAVEWGYLPEGSPNPARGVQRFAERSRDRYVRHGRVHLEIRNLGSPRHINAEEDGLRLPKSGGRLTFNFAAQRLSAGSLDRLASAPSFSRLVG